MKRFILVLGLMGLVLGLGAQTKQFNSKEGFSLTHPTGKGWLLSPVSAQTDFMLSQAPEGNAAFMVKVFKGLPESLNPVDFLNLTKANMPGELTSVEDAEALDAESLTRAGAQSGGKTVFYMNVEEAGKQVPVRIALTCFMQDGNLYFITDSISQATEEQYMPVHQKILDSFRIRE